MDVCESGHKLRKQTIKDTVRQPLLPADKNNAVNTRRPGAKEVRSRYKSPTPSSPSASRRCPSPNLARTASAQSPFLSKRPVSAERKRPSTPLSPRSPTTPVHDSTVDTHLSSRRLSTNRLPESLWPSTMRSLSVSFQSDTISIPVSKKEKEKPVSNISLDRTLRSSPNVAHKQQPDSPKLSRKPTPERKGSPRKGKSAPDMSENSKPMDSLPSRLIEQHRWPSKAGGPLSSKFMAKSIDLDDRIKKPTPIPRVRLSSQRTSVPDIFGNPLQKSASDAARLPLDQISQAESSSNESEDKAPKNSGNDQLSTISERKKMMLPAVRTVSLPAIALRPSSPSRTPTCSSSASRGLSPARSRPSTPPSRGLSPSRIRPSSPFSSQTSNAASVLSFIADLKRGRKGEAVDDAHQLRLLYNRYLQWRFTNARAEDVLYFQKVTAEETLCDVWNATLVLWSSVIEKRIDLQRLNLELKLNKVLNDQMKSLDDWASIEKDHFDSLSGAMEDFEASTLRLPVTGGAWVDIQSLEVAVCSAVDVMQTMGTNICSLQSKAEGVNSLISELAVVISQEKRLLDQYEALLTSADTMQVEEYSLRSHLIQMEQARNEQPYV